MNTTAYQSPWKPASRGHHPDGRRAAPAGKSARTLRLLQAYNRTSGTAWATRFDLLQTLLGAAGPGAWIEPPFYCDYGERIVLGSGVFLEAGCVIRDEAGVTIGDDTLIGAGVHIYSACHLIKAAHARVARRAAFPVRIGNNVWIGDGAIILPGVTIGDDAVIGSGSIVMENLPAGSIVAGRPCLPVPAL